MLNQKLQQKLQQKLSPQQIQLMKLLQIPSIALEQRIKNEIEENPALEEGNEEVETDDSQEDYDSQSEMADKDDDYSLDEYLPNDDDIPSYKLYANNYSVDDEKKEIPYSAAKTFHELLGQQLALRILDEKERQIAEYIIGNLDDSGYLQRSVGSMVDDLAFTQNFDTTDEKVEEILLEIQDLEPIGVGARNLRECLLIQINWKINNFIQENPKSLLTALMIVEDYFDAFSKKHYEKIIKQSGITEEELKEANVEIVKLNPKPGNSLGESIKVNHFIYPDFLITIEDDALLLSLNSRNAPELKVNRTYQDMLEAYSKSHEKNAEQKDAVVYIRQKIDSAKWFIDAIKQRQDTLYRTMKAIINYQRDYFLSGDDSKLRPMILKDVSEIVDLDISTISRVANSKYAQTPYGTFMLKHFFSESMETESGEIVSTREVKNILLKCVEQENKNKPYSDEKLMAMLNEKGYIIARRTVAKYREQLNIPVARLRKEL